MMFFFILIFTTTCFASSVNYNYRIDDNFDPPSKEELENKHQKYFKNSSEVAISHTSGNTQVETYNFKTSNTYRFKNNRVVFGGHYTYGEANSLLNAQNWDLNFTYLRRGSKHVSLVIAEILEGNRFQELKVRYNSDAGAKFHLINKRKQHLSLTTAYRHTKEERYQDIPQVNHHKARILGEYTYKPIKTLEWALSADYIPNFSDGTDWLFIGEASLKNKINSFFSLKISYKYMVDNLPVDPDLKKYDTLFSTSLVVDFD